MNLKDSNRIKICVKPNKIWVDKGRDFYIIFLKK